MDPKVGVVTPDILELMDKGDFGVTMVLQDSLAVRVFLVSRGWTDLLEILAIQDAMAQRVRLVVQDCQVDQVQLDLLVEMDLLVSRVIPVSQRLLGWDFQVTLVKEADLVRLDPQVSQVTLVRRANEVTRGRRVWKACLDQLDLREEWVLDTKDQRDLRVNLDCQVAPVLLDHQVPQVDQRKKLRGVPRVRLVTAVRRETPVLLARRDPLETRVCTVRLDRRV